jgi:hypothetical protein
MTKSIGWLAAAVLCIAAPAQAADSTFLKSFAGSWVGKGTVKVDADSQPIKINCKFASDATESSLALNGKCTGYVVFSRAIGADVKTNGKTYTGIYTDRALPCRPQWQSLRQRTGSRHPLGKKSQRRPCGPAEAGKNWRQWDALDDDR